jgi:large subunit ribosomal protein L13
MNTTVRLKASEIYKDWHVIDAAGRPLGRVATEAATLLRGKHKPTFEPHLDAGDFVIVVNASKVRVTGAKESQIRYYRHSGYPGGLKSRTYTEQMARFPDRVLEQAIWGMLPDGPLGKKMLRHLKVYAGPNHPHASQVAFTEKAQAARAEAAEVLKTETRKAPRLRPLSVPQAAVDRSRDREGAVGDTTTKPAPKARTRRQPATAAEAPVAAEPEVKATPVEAALPEPEAPVEPKPRRARKTASEEPTALQSPVPASPPQRDHRRRAPRLLQSRRAPASRRQSRGPAEAATEEKKPTRRRTTKSEE